MSVTEMIDYSYLMKTTPSMLEGFLGRGGAASDEMLAEAIGYFEPPLFSKRITGQILDDLDPKTESRGRPSSNNLSRAKLSRLISKIRRPDLPPRFRSVLAKRISTGKRFTEFQRSLPHDRLSRSRIRDMFVRGLYSEFYDLIDARQSKIHHEIFGELTVPQE